MMDSATLIWIIDGLLILTSTGLGWFARQLWDAVKELKQDLGSLKDDLSHLEVKIAKDYVPYDRLQDALKPIMESLMDIKDTLKTKKDKDA
jgi:septation ring formation regulator EzrA